MDCGEKSVKVEGMRKSAIATVKCGHCGLSKDVLIFGSISEPVDAFGDFIDIFYIDQELQRLEKRIIKMKEKNELGDLALSYSILSDICKAKAAQLLEDEDDIDMDAVNEWKLRAEKYKMLEKDVLLELDSQELEGGIKTDDESLFSEHASKIKKKKEIHEVFDDPGFLEF